MTFGNWIEAVYMEDRPQMQPLSARLVFHSASNVEGFLRGYEKLKSLVNGEYVFLTRLPVDPSTSSSSGR
jgi:hypothetical protein